MARKPVVGVLALQGAFARHAQAIAALGANTIEVRTLHELNTCDGLIIPGGESTTIMRHLIKGELKQSLKDFASQKPIFGTCAGLILLSNKIIADPMQPLQLINVVIERNAYGRQIDSFHTEIALSFEGKKVKPFPAFFIRAPRIIEVGENVDVLGTHEGEPVLIREGNILGATFHPELTQDLRIHQYFLSMLH